MLYVHQIHAMTRPTKPATYDIRNIERDTTTNLTGEGERDNNQEKEIRVRNTLVKITAEKNHPTPQFEAA